MSTERTEEFRKFLATEADAARESSLRSLRNVADAVAQMIADCERGRPNLANLTSQTVGQLSAASASYKTWSDYTSLAASKRLP